MTNAHLARYQPDGNNNITRGKNFVTSLRPSLRDLRNAVSNPHYVVNGQNINGYHYWQILLRTRQIVMLLDLAETSVGGSVGEESYTTTCRRYQVVVRETKSLYATQSREEAFRP